MTTKNKPVEAVSKLGGALGKGLLAGLAGTAAITASQMIEMRFTHREPSKVPANVAEKTLHIRPGKGGNKQMLSKEIHWAYGTIWGMARGLFSVLGVKRWAATTAHFVAITGTAMVAIPKIEEASPVTEWEKKDILIELMHHAVYAIAAGLVYDVLMND